MNHEYTDEAVCPHCDGEQSDSWEIDLDEEGVVICGHCDRDFYLIRHVSISYSSKPIREKTNG